jgi:hypothetical protein
LVSANSSDQILAARMVDAGLAAHRRVHLGQQRRGHLDERDPALIAGGRKAGHVADHSAAERDDAGVAGESIGDQHIEHPGNIGESLVNLPVRKRHLDATARRERGGKSGRVQRPHGGVRHEQHVARRDRGI